MITVSVIIPLYNRFTTIKRCIESIIHQTIKPNEIIVVDDGSSDGSIDVVKSINCDYLKLICQNHRGAQAARNLGIINATSEYVIFLDSDDEWLPDLLERMVSLAQKNCNSVIYSDGIIELGGQRKVWQLPGKSGNLYSFLLEKQAPTFDALLVKKDSLINIGLLDENVVAYQEWETSIRLAKEYNFIHLEEPLFVYHLHEGETISKNKKKDINGYSYIIGKHKKNIVKYCGRLTLKKHYKILAKKTFHNRDVRFFVFLIRYIFT